MVGIMLRDLRNDPIFDSRRKKVKLFSTLEPFLGPFSWTFTT